MTAGMIALGPTAVIGAKATSKQFVLIVS